MFNNRCSKNINFFFLFKLFLHHLDEQKAIEIFVKKVVIDEKLIEKLMPNDEQITKHFNKRKKNNFLRTLLTSSLTIIVMLHT